MSIHLGRARLLTAAVLIGGGISASAAVASGAEPATNECEVPTAGVLTVDEVPRGARALDCNLKGRTVREGKISLQIPEPGIMVEGFAEYAGSEGEAFAVAVSDSGEVTFPEADPSTAPGGGSSGPTACEANGRSNQDKEQAGTYRWHLGDGTRPAGLSTADTAAMLKQAAGWLTNTNNNCGMAESSNASHSYSGTSTLESDLTVSGGGYKCGDGSTDGHDAENVVDFGNLDNHGNPPLAVACTWTVFNPYDEDNIVHADIRFNTTDHRWYNTRPSGCSNRFDLRSVAVHEFGHTFGLGHVSEQYYGELTMSPQTNDCDESQRTLGRGDVYSVWTVY